MCVLSLAPTGDWTLDSGAVEHAPIWDDDLFGGARTGECIPSGPFANIESYVPELHCVTRGFNAKVASGMGSIQFDNPDVIVALIASGSGSTYRSFANFTAALELSHAACHIGIGGALMDRSPDAPPRGDMYYMSRSAGDPIFFSLHAAVDNFWKMRQDAHPSTRYDYDGSQGGVPVSPNDKLEPFEQTAAATFDLPCVTYAAAPPRPRGRSLGRRGGLPGETSADSAERVRARRAPQNELMADFLAENGQSMANIALAEAALDAAAVNAALGGPRELLAGPGGGIGPRVQAVGEGVLPPGVTPVPPAPAPGEGGVGPRGRRGGGGLRSAGPGDWSPSQTRPTPSPARPGRRDVSPRRSTSSPTVVVQPVPRRSWPPEATSVPSTAPSPSRAASPVPRGRLGLSRAEVAEERRR